jgi:hypothetical protein
MSESFGPYGHRAYGEWSRPAIPAGEKAATEETAPAVAVDGVGAVIPDAKNEEV